MRKKLILAVSGAMMFASAFADTQTVDGVTWTYYVENGMATIGGSPADYESYWEAAVSPRPESDDDLVIPGELGGFPVEKIGHEAFIGLSFRSIRIHASVKDCGRFDQAYIDEYIVDGANPNYCSENGSLYNKDMSVLVKCSRSTTELQIPDGVLELGSGACQGCDATNVLLSSSVRKLGYGAFQASSVCRISMPEGLVEIGDDAFWECNCLNAVKIPASVSKIGSAAFAHCDSLVDLTVDPLNPSYCLYDGALYSKDMTELLRCSPTNSMCIVPETVKVVGNSCFAPVGWEWQEQQLEGICFLGNAPKGDPFYCAPEDVVCYAREGSVGWIDFGTTELPDLWPVDAYGEGRKIVRWEGEPPLTHAVTFDLGEHGVRTGGGELRQVVVGGEAAIAPEVVSDGEKEFAGWSADFSFVIEDMTVSARYRDPGDYEDGKDYVSVTNGYTWTFDIVGGEATITDCTEDPVGHVVIPDELGGCPVVAIGESLFDASCRKDVSGLTGVTIPASVTSIGNWAFWCCTLLKNVVFEGDPGMIDFGYEVFVGTLYENGWPVPFLHMNGTVLTGIDWQMLREDCGCVTNGVLNIPEGTTAIADSACESLSLWELVSDEPLAVNIPESVKSIGDYAFAWVECLTDVSLPSTNGVSATAFNGTPWKLKTFGWKLPFFSSEPPDGGTPAVGTTYVRYETVFEDVPCAVSDKTVTFDGIALAANAFSEPCDKKIKAVSLLPNVQLVGSCAFSACPYLYQVTLGSTITAIASDAFGDDVELIDNLSFALDGVDGLLGGWRVVSDGSVPTPVQDVYPVAGNLPFKLGAGYLVSPMVKTVKVGPGLVSEFEIPDCCGIVRATITGVAGAEWTDFTECEYMGSNRESGEVPFCLCMTYAGIVDVEKTAVADADDYACYYLPQVNMACWGGWIPQSAYATEDDVADYFRNQPGGFDTLYSIFDWVDQNSTRFGCTESIWDAVSYPDYTNRTAAAFNRFIVENLKDGNALVMLGTVFSGHGITCCGYAVDSAKTIADGGYLKGLFIVDSDNDVYVNGGGRNAPNRITYCALEWVADPSDEDSGDYMIADIWGYSWDYVFCESALRAMKAAPAKPDGTYEEVVDGVKFNFTVIGGKASLGGGSNKATVVPTSTRGTVKVPATLGGCPVTALGRSAFDDCAGVTEVILPNGLQEVGSMAFRGCASLQQAFLPTSVASVGTGAFTGCTALEELTLPNGLASIGNYAFSYCGSVTAVTVPATVTSIGYMAFEGCTGIETVRFNGNVPSGLARSCLLDTATRVFYPRAYESAYAAIVPAEKFAGYSDTKGLMLMKAASAGRPVLVDDAWANETLDSRFGKGKVAEFKEKFGRDFAAALFKTTGKIGADGHAMTVLDDFISGTDPTDADSKFQAKIEIGADGKPKVTWTPDLNEGTTKDERTYRVMGAKNLGDGWTEVPSGNEADFNFFKVEVSMPNN